MRGLLILYQYEITCYHNTHISYQRRCIYEPPTQISFCNALCLPDARNLFYTTYDVKSTQNHVLYYFGVGVYKNIKFGAFLFMCSIKNFFLKMVFKFKCYGFFLFISLYNNILTVILYHKLS